MSQIKPVYTCPAYDVYPAPKYLGDKNLIALQAGDELACNDFRSEYYSMFTCGSVASGSLKRGGLNPGQTVSEKEELERSRHGKVAHHFIFGNSVCITSHKQDRKRYMKISLGDKVLYEGVVYTIERANNDNLKFQPVENYEWTNPW